MAFADHVIRFPGAEPTPALDHRRAMLDGDSVGNVAPTTICAIPFPAVALTPQMPVERALGLFIAIDMLVNPFQAHEGSLMHAQPATDLFRTPLFLEQTVDAVPDFGSNTPSGFGGQPEQREPVGLLRAIPAPPLISLHFTAHDGFVDTNQLLTGKRSHDATAPDLLTRTIELHLQL